MARRKTWTLAPDVEARMRPLWDAADRAFRTDIGMTIEIARAYHDFGTLSAAQSARRVSERR